MMSEKSLVKKIISGDKSAFAVLVSNYKRLVAHIIYTNIKNQNDRDDLSQEIFLKIYVNLGTFKFKSKLSTWIGRIAYHSCINFNSRNKTLLESIDHLKENDEDVSAFTEQNYGSEYLPIMELYNQDISKILRQTITQLPGQYQTVVTLFHLDELSYKEISEILDLSLDYIKVILFRARKLLKEKILMEYQEEEI